MQGQTEQSGAWYHFVESNYMTWFTEWMLKFGGKGAHGVLVVTTLYMSAELYPGVNLPGPLSIAVFLLQMFMLDVGGLGLATLARQAREQRNAEGAKQATRLSRFLIGIMIAGIVTVCVEHAVSGFKLTTDVQTWIDAIKIIIEVSLVVARAFCAVLYGVAIHSLKEQGIGHQNGPVQLPDYQQLLDEMRATLLTEMQSNLNTFRTEISSQIVTQISAQTVEPEPIDYNQIVSTFDQALDSKIDQLRADIQDQMPTPVDLAQLASEVAALLPTGEVQSALNGGSTEGTNTLVEQEDTGELDREQEEEVPTHTPVSLRIVSGGTKEGTNRGNSTVNNRGNTEATKVIHRLLKKNSTLGPTELAEKAGCSKRYASQVKQKYLASQQVS